MLLLFACNVPLPDSVTLLPPTPPPLVHGRATGHYSSAVSLADGLLVGGFGSLLLRDDGTATYHWIGPDLLPGTEGRVLIPDTHGDLGYDLSARTFGPAPERLRVDQGFTVDDHGVVTVGNARIDLGLEGARVTASERGDDGRVRVAFGPARRYQPAPLGASRLMAALGVEDRRLPTPLQSFDAFLVVTLAVDGSALREVSRWLRPNERVRTPYDDLGVADAVNALATRNGRTWAVWYGELGEFVGSKGWTPAGPTGIDLLVPHRDRLWAVGDGVWRLDGGRWSVVLDPWNPTSGDDVSIPRRGAQRFFGEARPALNGLALTDATGTCGDPSNPDRFSSVFGDCGGWIGLTADGLLYEGDPMTRLSPPIDEPLVLTVRDGVALVGGRDGVAFRHWPSADAWTRLPGPHVSGPVRELDVLVTRRGVELWFADATSICHSGDTGAADCVALRQASAIAAVPEGAWAVADFRLWFVPHGKAPVDRTALVFPGDASAGGSGLLYDPSRSVVWVASTDALLAIDPASGVVRRRWTWDAPPVLGLFLEPVLGLAFDREGLRVTGWTGTRLARFE